MLNFHLGGRHVRALASPARLVRVFGAVATLGAGCGGSQATLGPGAARPANESPAPAPIGSSAAPAPADPSERTTSIAEVSQLERALGEEATLPEILRVALARNPELAEARERVRAARELAPSAARLPDPEFEYQLWAQPLARPYALDEAQMHMFGIRQAFPAPGSLGAQSAAAEAQAKVATEVRRAREQDLVARVRRAYAEYHRADRERRIHLEHALLGQQALDMVRAAYQGGRGSQQDVLRTLVELSRLHNDVAAIERDRRTARGLLNTLMARAPDAPLGPPRGLEVSVVELRIAELERALTERRPEIAAREGAIRVRQGELEAARSSARWPSFMVGLQYMYMPPEAEPHNYGVMLSMSLPWLSARHAERVRAAEATLSAEEAALSIARHAARYALHEATERLNAARESLTRIEHDLLLQTEQSFESAQAAYRGGQADSLAMLDALRTLLDVRIERERALARVDTALADVELAVGGPIALPPKKMEPE